MGDIYGLISYKNKRSKPDIINQLDLFLHRTLLITYLLSPKYCSFEMKSATSS